jgi:hypothetical protein
VANAIIPVARALYLCDFYIGYEGGRVDLYGLFNGLRPAVYPHVRDRFVVYTQLTGGVGEVPVFIDVRHAERNELVHTTHTRTLQFRDRTALVQLAFAIEGCRFPYPGLYTVELFCHNTPVCDTTVRLHGQS